jgi:copper chaperone CopZ
MITVHVPAMTARADARVVSASISDVPGVRTLRVDLATRTVQVTGAADPAVVAAAVTATGYAVEEPPRRPSDAASRRGDAAGANPGEIAGETELLRGDSGS